MKRGGPLRRTPMKRATPTATRVEREPAPFDPVAAKTALTRQAHSLAAPRWFTGPVPDVSQRAPKPVSTGFPAEVRALILERDQHQCVACGIGVDTGVGYSLQHRDNRGMGGTSSPHINQPVNGLTMCGSGTTGCHGKAEANPLWANRMGFAVAWWADPETVPVHTWRGWARLVSGSPDLWLWCSAPPDGDAHTVGCRKPVVVR